MKEHLEQIQEIDGVEGVLLCTNSGKILGTSGLQLDVVLLERIARYAWRINAGFFLKEQTVKELELIYEDYRVIGMPKGEFMLLTFCKSKKAVSLIRMTLNVIITHLLEDKKFLKSMQKETAYKTTVLKGEDLDPREIKLISKLQ
jgi:hypothetical protein